MTPDREEALRLARTGDRSQMTRGDMSLLIDALASDLEAAEFTRDANRETISQLQDVMRRDKRDLANAREALERISGIFGPNRELYELRDVARAALRSLDGEGT